MRTRLMLRPGRRGTKKLTELYGDQLVCVRYRYDEVNRRRCKTVELIVDEGPWIPRKITMNPETIVRVNVEFSETELQDRVRAAGGKWDPRRCLWLIRHDLALELGLKNRIQA